MTEIARCWLGTLPTYIGPLPVLIHDEASLAEYRANGWEVVEYVPADQLRALLADCVALMDSDEYDEDRTLALQERIRAAAGGR